MTRAKRKAAADDEFEQADQNVDRNTDALSVALKALAPLVFEERIRTIRWVCEYYGIGRVALYQGDGTFKEQA